MTRKTPALVLSGGAEIIAAALLEECVANDIPVALISLGKPSILRDIGELLFYREMAWPPTSVEQSLQELEDIINDIRPDDDPPWPAFATEDGGLRLLLEGKEKLEPVLAFSGASQLKLGGLDKAELFEQLYAFGLEELCAPTRIASTPEQAANHASELGGNCIVKPALKPFSMQLDNMPSKVISIDANDSRSNIIAALRPAWLVSAQWLVQRKLQTPDQGEAVYWAVSGRQSSVQAGCSAHEIWKQPRSGGSGCWVQMDASPLEELAAAAEKIMNSLRYVGILELPFLQDDDGRWRLLELNPRPWLQVGLPYRAGLPLATMTYDVLAGNIPAIPEHPRAATWVNPERMVLAALSGEYGSRLDALKTTFVTIRTADVLTIYDTPLPSVKKRWLGRMLKTGLQRIMGK